MGEKGGDHIMKIIQVGPGGGQMTIGSGGVQISGNMRVSNNVLPPGLPPELASVLQSAIDSQAQSGGNGATVSIGAEEADPGPPPPVHASARVILSIPKRSDESAQTHEARRDFSSKYIQSTIEREYPVVSASVSFTLGTFMQSESIPQEVVSVELTGYQTDGPVDDIELKDKVSQLVRDSFRSC